MDIGLTPLADLDPAAVADQQAVLAALVADRYPGVETRRGPIHDLLLHLAAAILESARSQIDRLDRARSLRALLDDPELADPELIDAALSNFRVVRSPGSEASGRIQIVLSRLAATVLPAGVVFRANGVDFALAEPVVARVDAAQVASPSDRVLTPIGGGRYAFAATVTATTTGVAGRLRRGARVTPAVPIAHLDDAYAAEDFSGGDETESDTALAARFRAGIAAPAWSNRVTIEAMLRAQTAFAEILHVSIIGAGDPEMGRDRHGALPLAGFGRCDLLARTATLPSGVLVTLPATLVEARPVDGVWQVSLDRDAVPGFYEVTRVARLGADPADPGLEVLETIRGLDTTPDSTPVPDLETAVEAAFSRYATATVRIADPAAAGLATGTTTTLDLTVRRLPLIGELQAFLMGRRVAPPAGDVLARAPVPMDVRVHLTVEPPRGGATVDPDAVAAAIAAEINSRAFPGRVAAAQVARAAASALPDGSAVLGVELLGRLLRPDGTVSHAFGRDALEAPNEPDQSISSRTVAFFCDPADVGVSVRAPALAEL